MLYGSDRLYNRFYSNWSGNGSYYFDWIGGNIKMRSILSIKLLGRSSIDFDYFIAHWLLDLLYILNLRCWSLILLGRSLWLMMLRRLTVALSVHRAGSLNLLRRRWSVGGRRSGYRNLSLWLVRRSRSVGRRWLGSNDMRQ